MRNNMRYLLALPLLMSTPAVAQTSALLTLGTDYVSRGTTQTFDKPAAILYVEHQFDSGFYVAGLVVNIDFDNKFVETTFGDDGAFLETDIFVGKRGSISNHVSYDIGLSLIGYQGTKRTPGYNPSGNWDMIEAKTAVTYTTGPLSLTGTLGVTPDYFNNYGTSIWSEVSGTYAVTPKVTTHAAFGRQSFFQKSETEFPGEFSTYITWNAGVSYSLTSTLTADISYYDNDTKVNLGPIYKPRAVLSIRKTF